MSTGQVEYASLVTALQSLAITSLRE